MLVADQTTPYRLLTEVIYSCGQAGYANYRLLVLKSKESFLPGPPPGGRPPPPQPPPPAAPPPSSHLPFFRPLPGCSGGSRGSPPPAGPRGGGRSPKRR